MTYLKFYKKRYESDWDILNNLIPDAEEHGLPRNVDIKEQNIVLSDTDDDFHYDIALASYETEISGEFDVFDSDITEEDVKKAFELYGEELELYDHIPVLWDKEQLWNRCVAMAYRDIQETVYFFTSLYRGKDVDAFCEFLASKLSCNK